MNSYIQKKILGIIEINSELDEREKESTFLNKKAKRKNGIKSFWILKWF